MKKIFFTPFNSGRIRLNFLLPVIVVAFLLQGCCLQPEMYSSSIKPCNCKVNSPAYLVNNKKQPPQDDIQVNTAIVSSHEHTLNDINPVLSLSGERTKPLNPVAFHESTPSVQTLPHILLPIIDDTRQEARQNDPAAIEKMSNKKARAAKKMPLGIKAISTHIVAGPNISFKSSKEDYGGTTHKNKAGVGFQFGFGSSYYFSDKFAVAPSLLLKHNSGTEVLSYTNTGEPGSGGSTQEYETKYNYSYLSVPIMAEIKISNQFTLMAGPEINLLLSANAKTSGYGNNEKTDIKDNSVKTGVGIQAGIRYEIPGSPLGIQLIYDHRLSRLNEKSSDYYGGGGYDNPAWNMKSIQVGVTCAICELLKHMRK